MNLAATPWNEKEGYETMLIIKYERIDFFNSRIYTEDKKQNYTKEDLKKAFLYFSRTYDTSIQIDDTVIFWDSLEDVVLPMFQRHNLPFGTDGCNGKRCRH